MKVGSNGLALIKHFEGLFLKAYLCPANVWTIGYGHTANVSASQSCTKEQADAWLEHDVVNAALGVALLAKVPLTQNQFDALASFAFNVGTDIDSDDLAEGLGDSTLLKKLNAGDYAGAADQFLRWDKAKGVKLAGLTRRREAERRLFLTPDAEKFML